MKRDIVQVKFNITVPKTKWLAKINKKYPELTFNILSKFLLNNNIGNTLFQIKGPTIKEFLSDLKNISNFLTYQILFEGEDFVLLNIKTVDPLILTALMKTQLLLIYPLIIKNGKVEVKAIAERTKIDQFLIELESKNINFSIRSIGSYHEIELLTQRQNEILQLANKKGYYDIPRKISLSNLAKELNISPSALSETFRRIHKKISENYLS